MIKATETILSSRSPQQFNLQDHCIHFVYCVLFFFFFSIISHTPKIELRLALTLNLRNAWRLGLFCLFCGNVFKTVHRTQKKASAMHFDENHIEADGIIGSVVYNTCFRFVTIFCIVFYLTELSNLK